MIKKEIKSDIEIHSTPQAIWEQLTDFESYKDWNPFILSFTGKLKEDEKVNVVIKPYNSKPMTFTPTIIKVENYKEIRWLGRLFIKGLFDGEHYMELIDKGDNTTCFVQGEKFSGLLVPFMKNMIEKKTLRGFKLMNKALKKRVE